MKRVVTLMLVLIILISAAPDFVSADGGTIRISSSASVLKADDVFKVTVSIAGVPNMTSVSPSLHFDPAVVKVCDSSGNILKSATGSNFLYETSAVVSKGMSVYYAEFNNETGVIYVSFGSPGLYSTAIVDATQEMPVYSVYFICVASEAGADPDIHLSRKEDGEGRSKPNDYYDYSLYSSSSTEPVYYETHDTYMWDPQTSRYLFTMPPQDILPPPDIGVTTRAPASPAIVKVYRPTGGTKLFVLFDTNQSTSVIVAFYDGNNIFKGTAAQAATYSGGVYTGGMMADISIPAGATKYKIVMWGSVSNADPLPYPDTAKEGAV